MALELPFGLKVLNPLPVDEKYLNVGIPYINVAAVNATIPQAIRHTGLTVNVSGVEYWYASGVTDPDLIQKFTGGTGGGSTASGERIEKFINQTAHGFSNGDVVAYSGGSYVKGLAHVDFDGEIHGIATNVVGDTFIVVYAGYVTGLTSAGLSSNTTYFASDTVAGDLISTAPSTTGSTIKPMLATTSSVDEALVFQYLGFAVTTGVTGGGGDLSGATNLGGGEEVYKEISGGTIYFRTLSGTSGTVVQTIGDSIVISGGSISTGATLGIGEPVFKDVLGNTMNFKSIEGTGGTIVQTIGDTIYVSGASSLTDVVIDAGPTYNATNDDDYIGSSGITTVILPSSPTIGKEITIADTKGDGNTNNVTIQGNGNNINDNATATINTDYGSFTIVWNGVVWNVISFVN